VSDLTGVWEGNYAYPNSLQPVPFTVELRDHDGKLVGEVSEPAPPYMKAGEVRAIVTGECGGALVRFTKVYDTIDHFREPVRYAGTLDEDECEIAGKWIIGPGWSGTFVMTRPKPAREKAEVEEEATVEP
jgi:hypothetical protein